MCRLRKSQMITWLPLVYMYRIHSTAWVIYFCIHAGRVASTETTSSPQSCLSSEAEINASGNHLGSERVDSLKKSRNSHHYFGGKKASDVFIVITLSAPLSSFHARRCPDGWDNNRRLIRRALKMLIGQIRRGATCLEEHTHIPEDVYVSSCPSVHRFHPQGHPAAFSSFCFFFCFGKMV